MTAAKRVVVTGSTRGIGLGLAREFAARGCAVMVSGRSQGAVDKAVEELTNAGAPRDRVAGQPCEVTDPVDVDRLYAAAVEAYSGVDLWINNAGINQPRVNVWELDASAMADVVNTNLLGVLNGCRTAAREMVKAGSGAIYNMEGFGSDNRVVEGISVYGATKRAVRYATKALSKELKGTGVIAGALSPGIVITDLLLDDGDRDEARRAKAVKIFNILGDRVETVTPWLADKALANTKNNARLAWLTPGKAAGRFATASFRKRDIVNQREGADR